MALQFSPIIRIIEYRNVADIKNCVARLDVISGDDDQLFGAQAKPWIRIVVGGYFGIGAEINVRFLLPEDQIASNEIRVLAGFKIFPSEMPGFEIVLQP